MSFGVWSETIFQATVARAAGATSRLAAKCRARIGLSTNIAFHQAIINLSGSDLMSRTIENLFVHVRAIRRMTISQEDRASRSIVDHMRIIEALERRDTELAERLVRQHSLDLAAHVDRYCDFLD